eukprot:CAMPEP_0204407028 /NCGR_PEP_ID=MMETSP0470-20130426/8466_1 /ASSEMBLY_ACC=CAM_ASM_000385 /TAXON_ID=2969 /ORGANISM="Oxyrrhis marina" /LENGTH=158 /DNA_ID=CAMNT_0051402649 /DNA_START=585 /DNA_END=1058 /DNA_ORIENTATION=-
MWKSRSAVLDAPSTLDRQSKARRMGATCDVTRAIACRAWQAPTQGGGVIHCTVPALRVIGASGVNGLPSGGGSRSPFCVGPSMACVTAHGPRGQQSVAERYSAGSWALAGARETRRWDINPFGANRDPSGGVDSRQHAGTTGGRRRRPLSWRLLFSFA